MPYIRNLLTGVFYILVYQLYLKNGQKKKTIWYLSEEKTEKKRNIATIMISVDGKGAVFPMKLKF